MFIYKSKVAPTALRPGAVNFISLLCVYNLHCHRPPHIFKEGAIPVNHLEVEKISSKVRAGPTYNQQCLTNSLGTPGNETSLIYCKCDTSKLKIFFLANTIKTGICNIKLQSVVASCHLLAEKVGPADSMFCKIKPHLNPELASFRSQ